MQEKRIPLAGAVRWRRIRSRTVPVVTFLVAIVACGWLWQRFGTAVHGVGEVDAPRVNVTSPAAGLVVSLGPEGRGQLLVYDRVQSDDVIARIENERLGEKQSLEIRSPISGTLVAIHCWPGQSLPPGGLIATIAADYGRHIVGYVPEGSSLIARPGMPVTVRARVPGSRRLTSVVEQVGVQIEEVPNHQRTVSTTPEWGAPVRIKLPSDAVLRPGTLVDVIFSGSGEVVTQ